MGSLGKRVRRTLPHYYRRDQVGGLSHLLRHAKLGDIGRYARELGKIYDQDYADTCMIGLAILLEKDQDKYSLLDELAPEDPPRSNELDQQLMSPLIFRAMVPLVARPNLAAILIPGERTRHRALGYMQTIYLPAEELGKLYLANVRRGSKFESE